MVEIVKYLVFVLAVGISFGSRKWCLPIFCFFLPLSQWMPEVPIPAVNAMNLLLMPVMYQAIITPSDGKKKQGDPLVFPLGLFLFFVFISWAKVHFSSEQPLEWVQHGGLYNNIVTLKEFLNALVFYLCARKLTIDPEDRTRVLLGIVAGFAFEAMTAAREFLFTGAWRATGHLSQPNKLGAFLSGYIMIAFGFVINKDSKHRILALILLVTGCLGLLGSVSRGSMLAITLAIAGTLVFRRSFWVVPFVLVLAMAPLWLPEKVMSRFDEAVVESDTGDVEISQAGRIELWKTGMRMVADRPFGVGLEQFKWNLRKYGYTGRRTKSSHNIYVALTTEQGVPALLLHVFMFVYLGVTAYRISRNGRSPTDRCIGTGVLGMVLAFSISSSFGDGFYENNLSGNFWILAGMVAVMRAQMMNPVEPAGGPVKLTVVQTKTGATNRKVK